ncbi:MAG: DUF262 domain-containing HNH endonuclease family protein [Chloroflexi bacterium]|nr:DUF262 domain-containing HNH endonuclease family protein [Chloroflexota bacterium]
MPIKNISDVFDAYPKSAADFMRERGQGFFIPGYQRLYAWERSHIHQLIEDIAHGVEQLLDQDDATTFIGTLITIHDTENRGVEGSARGQLPGKVMTVIDGQQRLTTLMLTYMVLHDEIDSRHVGFKNTEDHARLWIYRQSVQTLSELIDTLEEDMNYGDGDNQWYPRMIREYVDQWSRHGADAKYESPIASLLHSYGSHKRAETRAAFKVDANNTVAKSFGIVRSIIRSSITRGTGNTISYPAASQLASETALATALFNEPIPEHVGERLDDGADVRLLELFRLVVFARFALHRVVVTVVTARSEDYAFDMFESLNTTGEALTAFETFKPQVVGHEGQDQYLHSDLKHYIDRIEAYLSAGTAAQRRQQATHGLLIAFAQAESGKRLYKRPSFQRSYLHDRFRSLDDDERAHFVRQMADTASFMHCAWDRQVMPPEGPMLEGLPAVNNVDKLCLEILSKSNHSITIGPLARIYSAQRNGAETSVGEAAQMMVAFFGLWRGAKRGTAGIDDLYRTLMLEGYPERDISPLSRLAERQESSSVPSLDELRKYLRVRLEEGSIDTRDKWVALAKDIPIYTESRDLTRLLLLAATHNTVADPEYPGLVKEGRGNVLELLNYESWTNQANITIEHIAPQSETARELWPNDLYENPETIDRIGNLLLLPSNDNSSISDRPWSEKRAIYRVLAATTADEMEKLIAAARAEGIEIPPGIAERTDYLPLTSSVGLLDDDWSLQIVEERSVRLLQLAWGRLAPWLGL